MAQSRERTLSVTTLAEMRGEFHSPNLQEEYFPSEPGEQIGKYGSILGNSGDWYAMDRLMIVRLLMAMIVAVFFVVAVRRPKLVSTGLQNAVELMLDFVRVYIAEEILGKEEGRRFLPVLVIIFSLVISMNIVAIIPGLNISPNARIGMPLVLALFAYVAFIYASSKKMGFPKFVKSAVVIPSLPPVLHLIVVPIEIFSNFVPRPVTLTIRLMANMLAGHMVLILLFGATNFFFWQLNGWIALSGLTLVAAVAFTLSEMLVIFLQAYIFALLSAVYIKLSLRADEH